MPTKVLAVAVVLVAVLSPLNASSTGVAGGGILTGCSGCHGSGGITVGYGATPVTQLYPGQTATYTILIQKITGTSSAKVGLNVAASSGTLAAVSGEPLTLSSGQIIHSTAIGALRTLGTGSTSYQVQYTMSTVATPGTGYTLNTVSAAPGVGAAALPLTVTAIRPANPTGLASTGATTASISLSWSGTGPSYRVLRKSGSAPASPTDGTIIYEGAGTSTTASGLAASTTYYFAVYGAATYSATTTYSSAASTTSASTAAPVPVTWYVKASTGADTNPGTSGSPFRTITKALTVAASIDIISVASGTYNQALGEAFPLPTVSGVDLIGAGASTTIIDATGTGARVIQCIDADNSTIVEGFTIKGGTHNGDPNSFGEAQGGGVYCYYTCNAIFRRNIIEMNQALGYAGQGNALAGGPAYGGGVYIIGGLPRFENNIIRGNLARGGKGSNQPTVADPGYGGGNAFGGGLYAAGSQDIHIVNNTFYGNTSQGGNGGDAPVGGTAAGNGGNAFGGGLSSFSNRVFNNIIANNSAIGGSGGTGTPNGTTGTQANGGLATSSVDAGNNNNLFYMNAPDNSAYPGTAAVIANPQFLNAGSGDLRIPSTSPAAGAGSPTGAPAADFAGTTRPSPPAIGAYEPLSTRLELHGDFNGDGRDDILLVDQFAMAAIWLMNGTAITAGASPGSIDIFKVVGIADLNGDGKSDIVLQDPAGGNVGCWIMNGTAISSGHLIGSPGGTYAVAGVADFTGDGKADILLRDAMGNLGLWIMNGPAITGGGLIGSPGAYTVAGVADFNADAKADILLRDNLGNLGMWLMNGATIASGGFVGSPGAYTVVAAADLENNGRADIVLRDSLGNIGVWFMNGFTITGGALIGSPGGYSVNSAGDYDGDNRADLLLRESTTGAIGTWFMNGSTIVSGGFVASPGANYSVY